MAPTRRQFLESAASLVLTSAGRGALASAQARKGTRLILLGTKGGPSIGVVRSNPSTVLLINDVGYIVDCGAGTTRQLVAAGIAVARVRYVFLTHLHSDHMLEYGPLVYNGWASGVGTRVDAYGPPPLKQTTQAFWEYVKFDVDIRIEDEGRPDPRQLLVAHELDAPGTVLQNDDVKVTSALVVHPPIKHAYAFRFDTRDRSIVVSGDTNYSSSLIALAKGADVLVHEVVYVPSVGKLVAQVANAATLRQHIIDSHTSSEDVGKVAAEAGVKTLVLSHFVPGNDADITDDMWSEGARRHFKGRIIVGKDLMEI